jgi:hypothetical protein
VSNQHSPQEREIDRYEHQPDGTWKVSVGDWVRHDDHLAALQDREAELEKERDEWKGRTEPDTSPGDVIAAYPDGVIVLDDGITTWNPTRAVAFLLADSERRANRAGAALREAREELERRAEEAEVEAAQYTGLPSVTERNDAEVRRATYGEALDALDTSIGEREPEKQQQVGERCGGSGRVRSAIHDGVLVYRDCIGCPDCKPPAPEKCDRCKGTGLFRGDYPCGKCNGTGTKPPAPVMEDFSERSEASHKLPITAQCEPPAPCSDRASTQGGSDDVVETGGEPEPDGGLGSETSTSAREEDDATRLAVADAPCLTPNGSEEDSRRDAAEPSSSDQEGEAERIAEAFHAVYESLALARRPARHGELSRRTTAP